MSYTTNTRTKLARVLPAPGNLPIRAKMLIPMIGTLAIIVAAFSIYFPRQHRRVLLHAYTREATGISELFSAAVAYALTEHSFELLQKTLQRAKSNDNIVYIIVLDANREQIASYGSHHKPELLNSTKNPVITTRREDMLALQQQVLAENDDMLGYLLLGYSLNVLKRETRNDQIATVILAVCSFLIGLFIINKVSVRITRSLRQLHSQMTEVITAGCYTSPVKMHKNDEVGQLAKVFNKMMTELLERQQRIVESKRRYQELFKKVQKLNHLKTIFVADASHHLRTPLTIMRGEIEVTLQKDRDAPEYRETLRIVGDEVRTLSHIVENLLTLAKADSGNLVVLQNEVDLSRICVQQVQHLRSWAEERGILMDTSIEKNCILRADPGRLSEVVFNLVENAIKYTSAGNIVAVGLARNQQQTILSVSDSGPGLQAEELDSIFERFYRGQNSSQSSKGTGLGLAICKSIVDAHAGEIRVSSDPGQGTTFEVVLQNAVPENVAPGCGASAANNRIPPPQFRGQ